MDTTSGTYSILVSKNIYKGKNNITVMPRTVYLAYIRSSSKQESCTNYHLAVIFTKRGVLLLLRDSWMDK